MVLSIFEDMVAGGVCVCCGWRGALVEVQYTELPMTHRPRPRNSMRYCLRTAQCTFHSLSDVLFWCLGLVKAMI